MAGLVVSLTHAADSPDRATVALWLAHSAQAAGLPTVLFLSSEGAWLAPPAPAAGIHEAGFAPLETLLSEFTRLGGTIWVCGSCFRRRGLDPARLRPGATVVGGATLVEFLLQGGSCLSY